MPPDITRVGSRLADGEQAAVKIGFIMVIRHSSLAAGYNRNGALLGLIFGDWRSVVYVSHFLQWGTIKLRVFLPLRIQLEKTFLRPVADIDNGRC